MGELVFTVLLSIVNIALPYAVVRRDRLRLASEERDRAWNAASLACAIYFYGPLSLPAHFWITRRRWLALGQGALWTVAIVGTEWALTEALEKIFP